MSFKFCFVFYNSLNVDFLSVKSFYEKINKFFKCFRPIDITNRYELANLKENIKKLKIDEKILMINLGGDGSLFSSLSFLATIIEITKIYTVSFNFGNKGFYCFYSKDIFYDFINEKFDLVSKIDKDYMQGNYLTGSFWIVNNEHYFIGDVTIKSYIPYKTIKLSYKVGEVEIEETADGILLFTTFGATGYFLSLNGIYIDIDLEDLIGISFIAPHSLKSRPVLLKNKEIVVTNKDKKMAIILTDGQDKLILEPQNQTIISKSSKTFTLLGQKNTFEKWIKNFYEK